jgi:hypothetical protein
MELSINCPQGNRYFDRNKETILGYPFDFDHCYLRLLRGSQILISL